jgi:hypothetical protein
VHGFLGDGGQLLLLLFEEEVGASLVEEVVFGKGEEDGALAVVVVA